jgi:hypothetical protein
LRKASQKFTFQASKRTRGSVRIIEEKTRLANLFQYFLPKCYQGGNDVLFRLWSQFFDPGTFNNIYLGSLALFGREIETTHRGMVWFNSNRLEMTIDDILLSSRYPFSLENPWVFGLVYVYQVFGISMSACFNCSTDTLGSAMIAQINGQVKRLGIQLTKVCEPKKKIL